jgi:hypothetical protein
MSLKQAVKNIWYVIFNQEEADNRLKNFRGLENKTENLTNTLFEKQKTYDILQGDYGALKKCHDEIEKNHTQLEKRYECLKFLSKYAVNLAKEARGLYLGKMKSTYKEIQIRVDRNRLETDALNKWQKPFENKMNSSEKESKMLRGCAFSTAVNIAIKSDSRSEKIPFVYYDFINRSLEYTSVTPNFLGIEEADEFTLKQLLSKIDKGSRKGIIDSLRDGKYLEHYPAKIKNSEIKIHLSSYPVFYNEKIVGAGIFLNDPKNILRRPYGTSDLVKKLKNISVEAAKKFSKISERAKNII